MLKMKVVNKIVTKQIFPFLIKFNNNFLHVGFDGEFIKTLSKEDANYVKETVFEMNNMMRLLDYKDNIENLKFLLVGMLAQKQLTMCITSDDFNNKVFPHIEYQH